jgi:L-fuculose-phosphate aldolase
MNVDDLRQEFISISRLLYDRGMVPGTSGNVSVRVPGTDTALIKCTARSFGDLECADVLLVDFDGKVLEGHGKPSKEAGFHLPLYRMRPDVGAVVHVHPPFATAWASAGRVFPMATITAEIKLGPVPLVGRARPGSGELAKMVLEAYKDPAVHVALLRDHGSIAVGGNLREAYYLADLVEDTARVAMLAGLIRLIP